MDYHDMAESLRRQQQWVDAMIALPPLTGAERETAAGMEIIRECALEPPNNDRSPFGCYLRRRGRK